MLEIVKLGVLSIVCGAFAAADLSAEPGGPLTANAPQLLADLCSHEPPLVLSQGDGSARDSFVAELTVSAKNPGSEHDNGFRATVVRRGAASAILVSSLTGLPYAYMADKLLIMVDSVHPGGLVVCHSGAPQLLFRFAKADGGGHADLQLSFDSARPAPEIALDIKSLLESAVSKISESSWDPSSRRLSFSTAKSKGEIDALAPETWAKERFPVRSLALRSIKTSMVFRLMEATPAALSMLDVDPGGVSKIGLPTRELLSRDKPLMTPPVNFGQSDGERLASHELTVLFPVPRATTGPSDVGRQPHASDVFLGQLLPAMRQKFSAIETSNEQKHAFQQLIADASDDYRKVLNDFQRHQTDSAAAAESVVRIRVRLVSGLQKILGTDDFDKYLHAAPTSLPSDGS